MLTFLGRGSAFSDEQNCAFFRDGEALTLIDLSMDGFHKLRRTGIGDAKHIYIIVTHTHGDHVGGIPMLIHYAFFVWHIPVTVGAPSEQVAEHLEFLIKELDGCDKSGYNIVPAAELPWVKRVISTEHAPQLAGRCFGYELKISGRQVIYTGDTATLDKFLPYLTAGTVLYTEISTRNSPVHLFIDDVWDTLCQLSESGVEVNLMHLDNEQAVEEAVKGTKIKLAKLYK